MRIFEYFPQRFVLISARLRSIYPEPSSNFPKDSFDLCVPSSNFSQVSYDLCEPSSNFPRASFDLSRPSFDLSKRSSVLSKLSIDFRNASLPSWPWAMISSSKAFSLCLVPSRDSVSRPYHISAHGVEAMPDYCALRDAYQVSRIDWLQVASSLHASLFPGPLYGILVNIRTKTRDERKRIETLHTHTTFSTSSGRRPYP